MVWFRKKKKEKPVEKFLREYRELRIPPKKGKLEITSKAFRLFKEKEKLKLNWYEKTCRLAERILKFNLGKQTQADLSKAIDFTGLRITPIGVGSFVVLTILFFIFIATFFTVLGAINPFGGILITAVGFVLAYYILKYPINRVKTLRIQASTQVVLATLYMVVSMRISPNLERALRFTASNISGILAWDLRRLLWDIEMGHYYSANEALTDYIAKWKPENEEFAESLRLIRDSQYYTPTKAEKTLSESLDVILSGTRTRMKRYAQDLKLPVMIIHMMGIVLPLLGSIMAPMAAVFLAELVSPIHFIVGYDIVLPIVIIWFINNTLGKRPITFSKIDISEHPDLPSRGTFLAKFGKRKLALPLLPLALLIGSMFCLPAVYYFSVNPDFLLNGQIMDPNPILSLTMSILIMLGVGFALSIYFILSNLQKRRIQSGIISIESQFELALFQLGNRIAGGTPTELALEKSLDDVKDLKIAGLFRSALKNMRSLGMTFEESLFDPKYGALKYYPSKLIYNVMYTVVDTAKKGVRYASDSMLTISKYLKNIRETQEYLRDLLEETVSSMKFQAYALTPMICGLIVSMAQIIISVLALLGQKMEAAGVGGYLGESPGMLMGGTSSITPALFQLIIGTYLIEVIIILAIFLTKITWGENRVVQWYSAGVMLIAGIIMYFLVALGSSLIFGGLIGEAMIGLIG